MTDGLMGEHPEEALHMQVRVGTESHQFPHDASRNAEFVLNSKNNRITKSHLFWRLNMM